MTEIICEQIELREDYTDPSNHWKIKSVTVTASSHSATPSAPISLPISSQYSNVAHYLLSCWFPDCWHLGHTVPPYVAIWAGYDCHTDRSACLENTRTSILDTILAWASDRSPPDATAGPAAQPVRERHDIFWLNGLAGTGKTTVAYTVAQRCREEGILGASFFCSRSIANCNDPLKIFPTIAYQLGLFHPPLRALVAEALQRDPLLVYASFTRQFEELILQPLQPLRDSFPLCNVVIDALDECNSQHATPMFLSALLKHAHMLFPLRFFITSRPELHITASFRAPGHRGAFGQLLLHEVPLASVAMDIRHFLETSLMQVGRHFGLIDSWPTKADVDMLSRLTGGLFIFAATAVKFIGDKKYSDPDGQLGILTSKAASHGSHTLLDGLYLQVLESAFPEVSEGLSTRLKTILGSIVLIKDPLPPTDLSHLIGLPAGTVHSSLSGLHSVLVVPERMESTANISIIHPTFAEFLVDPERCVNPSFAIDPRRQHTMLLRSCLEALRGLKRDICNIRDPSLLNVEVLDLRDRLAKAFPLYVQYACRHWVTHLSSGDLPDDVLDTLLDFAEHRLLHWLEACSLLGVLRDAISALRESQLRLTASRSLIL